MIVNMKTIDEFVSDSKQGFSEEQLKDSNLVKSCERNAKLIYYQTILAHTDYIPLKIIEGAATAEDYADELKQRQEAREQINNLMKPLE